jgi:cation transport regulator ChaC
VRRQHVFGYGSLPAETAGVPCWLHDHHRDWGVAMDNRRTVPGYKIYLDPDSGERPPVYVAYLSIRPEPGARVDGTAFAVDDAQLALLDRRERNYERRDVTDLLDADLGGRVWAYVGSAAGRRRFARGREDGTAVVSRGYLERVRAAFPKVTVPPDLEVRTLLRCDVGP